MEKNKRKFSRGNILTKLKIDSLRYKTDKIKSINSIFHKINTEKRYEIVVIVIEEEHYEDV
jgi:hypothetical protein